MNSDYIGRGEVSLNGLSVTRDFINRNCDVSLPRHCSVQCRTTLLSRLAKAWKGGGGGMKWGGMGLKVARGRQKL